LVFRKVQVMKISIVTPVYNGERFLRKAVESVLTQEGDFELEYIVKDGGSTDGSLSILNEYAENDSRLTVLTGEDLSLYDAMGIGMARATGQIGATLCADDFYHPGALQRVVEAFEKNPDKEWLYGDCDIVDSENRPIRSAVTLYKQIIGFWFSRFVLHCENFVNTPSTFWRIDAWRDSGGMDVQYRYAADYGYWLKLAKRGRPIHLREHLTSFRRMGESVSDLHFEEQFKEELDIAKKHVGPLAYWIHWLNCKKIILAYRWMS
jgi:glycosyltransferase involved in cell wall biosynthesis